MKKVIFYGLTPENKDIYFEIVNKKGIEVSAVDDTQLEMRFKQALNIEPNDLGNSEAFEHSYLLMEGLSKEEIRDINNAFDEVGKHFDGIMVSATPTNREWSLRDIFTESLQEARVMHQMYTLQTMIESTNGLDLNKLNAEDASIVKQALMDSYLMLVREENTYEQLTGQIKVLQEALKKTEHLKEREN